MFPYAYRDKYFPLYRYIAYVTFLASPELYKGTKYIGRSAINVKKGWQRVEERWKTGKNRRTQGRWRNWDSGVLPLSSDNFRKPNIRARSLHR